MRIDNSNISFSANFKNYVKILKRDQVSGKYFPADVAFVTIDSRNLSDLRALKEVYDNWGRDVLTEGVLNAAVSKSYGDKYFSRNKIYALTSQSENFEKLNPSKILGVADIRVLGSKGNIFLEHLKVCPFLKGEQNPDIKKVGTAILNSLKAKFVQIFLVSLNKPEVKDFYRRNAFKEFTDTLGHFSWHRK